MTTSARGTEVVPDPQLPLVWVRREFDAPRAQVFNAHVEPALVARWLGPRGGEFRIDHYDGRTGGSYSYAQVLDGVALGFRGCFHEVRAPELIIMTFTFEAVPERVGLERLVFEDIGGQRTRFTSTFLVDSFEERDAVLAGGMAAGVRAAFDRLDELLID